ncbi:30S ribosomal protein S1 [Desemzia incerta]|uniref:SSU ribosomal protein S1P n=1 Tax=Desemzia incerta TaxID=82801 RepID=A0A1I5WRU5_9LACT|nr:30S ribosomal protein S1 [Desemzia incerta]SFQ22514.1 SSU ribosomal protein S1P [Desemzia incerta]
MTENENVHEVEEQQSMSDVMKDVEEISIGDIVEGEVLAIDENKQAIVGLGGGLEGVIPHNELSASPFENVSDVIKVGDKMDLVVIKESKDKENGSYLLSKRRIEAKKVWEKIQKDYEEGNIIEAPVTNVVKGGLVVDVGVRGFVPASMVEVFFVDDFSEYKGKTMTFKIIEIEPSENRLILSHKAVAEAENEAKKEEVLANLVEGETVTGTVARLTNFGAFIDLGGVDGLVHISEISYGHVNEPSDELTVGEEVQVKILSVNKEEGRISLSIKETLPGPWDDIEERATAGAILEGEVKRLTSFGAFIEVFPGVEGLVHISQISHNHIATPHEVLTVGEKIKVKVLSVSPEEQRLSLSIKALEEKPERIHQEPRAEEVPEVEEETGFTLGDLIGDQLADISTEEEDSKE